MPRMTPMLAGLTPNQPLPHWLVDTDLLLRYLVVNQLSLVEPKSSFLAHPHLVELFNCEHMVDHVLGLKAHRTIRN